MQPAAMLAQLARDGAALLAAATDPDAPRLDLPVPTCPGWTVRDTVLHTAEVYAHKATIVEGSLQEPPDPWPPAWDIADPLEWFDEQLHRVLEALRSRDPATSVGTWYEPDQSVGFWVRRMMQETVIHRADVESATGTPSPVDPEVAVDGIDELLVRMLAYDVETYLEAPGDGQRILVDAGDAAWTVTLGPDRLEVSEDVVDDPEATVTGSPSDVLLALWNRLSYDELETSGDDEALALLRSTSAAITQ